MDILMLVAVLLIRALGDRLIKRAEQSRINTERRKLQSGHCLACGYDLRATPHRCPECGTIPPPEDPTLRL